MYDERNRRGLTPEYEEYLRRVAAYMQGSGGEKPALPERKYADIEDPRAARQGLARPIGSVFDAMFRPGRVQQLEADKRALLEKRQEYAAQRPQLQAQANALLTDNEVESLKQKALSGDKDAQRVLSNYIRMLQPPRAQSGFDPALWQQIAAENGSVRRKDSATPPPPPPPNPALTNVSVQGQNVSDDKLALANELYQDRWYRSSAENLSPDELLQVAPAHAQERITTIKAQLDRIGAKRDADGNISVSPTKTVGDASTYGFTITEPASQQELHENKIKAAQLYQELDDVNSKLQQLTAPLTNTPSTYTPDTQ